MYIIALLVLVLIAPFINVDTENTKKRK